MVKKETEDFKTDNPAMVFLSYPEGAVPMNNRSPGRPAYTDREAMNKKVQLLMKPSVYAKLKATADAKCMSVNALINRFIEQNLKLAE